MRMPVLLVCCAATAATTFWLGRQVTEGLPTLPNAFSAFSERSAIAKPIIEEVPVEITYNDGTVARIAVAKHEVTFGEWQNCVAAGGCGFEPERRNYVADDHPVSGVSWHDAQRYIAWITEQTGHSYRLPLESEWRALAADLLDKDVDKLFDDPRLAWAADYANFGKRAERRTHPVGHFGTEENGIADLAGNVWEWTDSCWRNATSGANGEPRTNCGGVRVLAGAHMTYQSELIRVVPTGGCSIGFPPANIGFRLVRDLDGPPRTAQQNATETSQRS